MEPRPRARAAVPALLGIDVGTSSVKAVALSVDGEILARAGAGYATSTPHPGWAEQDPEDWWEAVGRACRELAEGARDAGRPFEVVAIGLSGQMHTFVLLGRDERPLAPAITWMDTRAAALLGGVREIIARSGLAARLANPVVAGLTLPPLVWLRDQRPSLLHEAHRLLSTKDYVRLRLTGETGSEPTDASATLMADVPRRRWSHELMAAFGLPVDLLPALGESEAEAGRLTPAAARHLGLPQGIPVAYGAGDQQAAAVGTGSVRAGRVQLTVGTGAQVIEVKERGDADPGGRLHTFCHVRDWIAQASVNNAGAALSWVRTVLGVDWEDLYGDLGRAGGPCFVPYLTGERTPLMKGHARGAWIGLSNADTRHDLARAAGDGVVASIAEAIDAIVGSAPRPEPLRAAGGGMRNEAFAQAIADASGHAVEVHDSHDASAVGAALLGGLATGAFRGLDAAVAVLPSHVAARYVPDERRHRDWLEKRRLLRELDAIGLFEAGATAAGQSPTGSGTPSER